MSDEQKKTLWGIDMLNVPKSDIPAVTHVDYSARVQTVSRDTNPDYYDLISEFDRMTGCPVIVNTSFNVRGEPIVCTPEDAYRCFMRTHIDYSARIQTVRPDESPAYHRLISAFESLTGCPVVVNTSFNVRGEPIVCTPEDAYRCFMRTNIDHLVLWPFILDKQEQPEWREEGDWRKEVPLD